MNYNDFVKMLRINKHRLDDELELQSELFHKISEELSKAGAKEAQAKEDLDRCESELYLDLTKRESASKMTKDQAQATINLDKGRCQLWTAWQAAKSQKTLWQGLYDAWKSRGFDLKALGDLYADNYFVIDSAGQQGGSAGRREHQRLREEAAEQRHHAHRRRNVVD